MRLIKPNIVEEQSLNRLRRSTLFGVLFLLTFSVPAFAARPVVSSISPASGSTAGGDAVVISGSNFVAGATVKIGGVAAGSVVVSNSSTITAVTPPHAAGVVSVQVFNPGKGNRQGQLKNAFTYLCVAPPCIVAPVSVSLDDVASATSDGNGIAEPGESNVRVVPTWLNTSGGALSMNGVLGPLSGLSGTIDDATMAYASAADGQSLQGVSSDAYAISIGTAARAVAHWDAAAVEMVTTSPSTATPGQSWTIHLGDSFSDVPRASIFYRFVETLLHSGVTSGCGALQYCPGSVASRDQMAVFIARSIAGGDDLVPETADDNSYSCTNGGVSLFTDVGPTDLFCRHIHYIRSQNVTLGCTPTQFCPTTATQRGAMAMFIARALVAPAGDPGIPAAVTVDPNTGLNEFGFPRQYDCTSATGTHFTDVPSGAIYCKQVHYLWARGAIDGFPDGSFGPGGNVTRDQMSKFLVNGFGFTLD